jgi:membrane dipeptidase
MSSESATHAEEKFPVSDEARRIHQDALVFDGHNDLPWVLRQRGNHFQMKYSFLKEPQKGGHTDIPRLRAGNVGAQFWSAWVPVETAKKGTSVKTTLEQIDIIHRMIRDNPDVFEMAATADDVVRIHKSGKIASMIGIEGGHSIDNSLGVLRLYYTLGARYMTLTHTETIDWADSATDEAKHHGLTAFGEEVVREMNRLGMLVDISHVSPETMRHAIRVSRAPVIASHSSAWAIAQHPRNVPDDVLKLVAQNNGVVMVNFYSGFIVPEAARITQDMFGVYRMMKAKYPKEEEFKAAFGQWRKEHPTPKGRLGILVDHIDHIVKVAGIDHVGLGSDYDGITEVPEGLEDVSTYPRITQELLRRGYKKEDIQKILGGNILRVLRQAEEVAKKLQASK